MGKSINNANQLTHELLNILIKVKRGKIELRKATTMANLADKVCKNIKNQIEYKKLTGSKNKIPFLTIK